MVAVLPELLWEPVAVCVCVVLAMACSWVLQTNEEAGRDRRPLACRRSVSWYGLRLNIIKETHEMSSELSQVRQETKLTHLLTLIKSD